MLSFDTETQKPGGVGVESCKMGNQNLKSRHHNLQISGISWLARRKKVRSTVGRWTDSDDPTRKALELPQTPNML